MIRFLLDTFQQFETSDALVWHDQKFSYGWLGQCMPKWRDLIHASDIVPGSIVALEADFSPNGVALFLALIEHQAIIVPLTQAVKDKRSDFLEIAQVESCCSIDDHDHVTIYRLPYNGTHPLYKTLRERGHPGLVLFSSGSTGKSKAAVHDLTGLLEKFKVRRNQQRTISFLLYDHIGGVNTLLYTLSNGGCLITVQDRTPDQVLAAIEKHKASLLPTSPTFLNLILLSEAYKRYDLSSLKIVSYGTEPMLETTLKRFHTLFPDIQLLQTYGSSEVGILRSKSKSSDSLWLKVGGEGFDTRVVDGILQIKAQSAMLGYLNAPSPFTEDGWFNTNDAVEVDGEFIRIIGRKNEIINVGGEKVYPAEVESVIQELPNVAEVTVYGEKNPITGNIVCADVRLVAEGDTSAFTVELKRHCAARLEPFKVPVKIRYKGHNQYSERFKKIRSSYG